MGIGTDNAVGKPTSFIYIIYYIIRSSYLLCVAQLFLCEYYSQRSIITFFHKAVYVRI